MNLNFWLLQTADVFYSITDFLGNTVKQETQLGSYNGNQSLAVDISDLEIGVYFLKLRAGQTEQRKIFIKN